MIARSALAAAILVLIGALAEGCSTLKTSKDMLPHMISLDKSGKSFDLAVESLNSETAENKSPDKIQFHDNIKMIIDGLKNEVEATAVDGQRVELLIFVHGGMISKESSEESARAILHEINNENIAAKKLLHKIKLENAEAKQQLDQIGQDTEAAKKLGKDREKPLLGSEQFRVIYPVFVNWQSGMVSAYLDHLFTIRQGMVSHVWGGLSFPLYFAADLGRAVTRLPITYGYQGIRALTQVKVEQAIDADRFYTGPHPDHGIHLGTGLPNGWEKFLNKTTYVVPGALKFATTPFLDTFGKAAWENMLRRTKTIFSTPENYNIAPNQNLVCLKDEPDKLCEVIKRSPGGGLSQLMQALEHYKADLKAKNEENKLKVTLVGHSMGAIVVTELLRRFNDPDKDFTYENIVLMAAASTVRDFQDSVVPYLKSNTRTQFYNLTLHPYAEENELTGLDSLPRGSLLMWIDEFASDPATLSDFTFGKWNNAVKALPFTTPEIRNRITLKGFGIKDGIDKDCTEKRKEKCKDTNPTHHGDFNNLDKKFWKKSFWSVPGTDSPSPNK